MKDRIIRVLTVPGSGTHSMIGILKDAGLKVHQRHYGAPPREVLVDMSSWARVSTIRDPVDNYGSFYNGGHNKLFNFQRCWEELNDRYLYDNQLLVLPIDHPDRDKHLRYMSAVLDVELKTDWEPLNKAEYREGRPVMPDEIFEIIRDLEIVKKFYPSI